MTDGKATRTTIASLGKLSCWQQFKTIGTHCMTDQPNDAAHTREMLGKLRIDRNRPPTRSRPAWLAPLGGAAVVAALAAGAWMFMQKDAVPPSVATVIVEAPAGANNRGSGNSVLDASGYVIARRQATVSAKVTGKVIEVLIEEGLQVEEGQVLARLDDSIPRGEYELSEARLEAAQAGLQELDTQLQQARLDERRAADLVARELVSAAEGDRTRLLREGVEARLARTRADIRVSKSALAVQQRMLDDLTIRAPFRGVIVAKAAQPGEMISPISAGGGFTRTGIGTLVDMDSLEVEVDVNEAYINRVQAEQPVTVVLNAYPQLQIKGRVIAIIPTADRNKATVRVRIGFVERDERVLPDMGVKVSFLEDTQLISAADGDGAVLLPRLETASLRGTGANRFVFVVTADNTLEQRSVRTGEIVGSQTRIEAGVVPGERVLLGARDGSEVAFTAGMLVAP